MTDTDLLNFMTEKRVSVQFVQEPYANYVMLVWECQGRIMAVDGRHEDTVRELLRRAHDKDADYRRQIAEGGRDA